MPLPQIDRTLVECLKDLHEHHLEGLARQNSGLSSDHIARLGRDATMARELAKLTAPGGNASNHYLRRAELLEHAAKLARATSQSEAA